MTLLDTSAWVHYLRHGGLTFEQMVRAATCPPVVQEVLQGVRDPRHRDVVHDGLMALPIVMSPAPLGVFVEASEIYRIGRRKGVPIRSGVDCLIAAMAIGSGLPVHHFDPDFDAIAKFTALRTVDSL